MNETVPTPEPDSGAAVPLQNPGPLDGFSGRPLSLQEEELVKLLRVAVNWDAPAWSSELQESPELPESETSPGAELPPLPEGKDPLAEWKALLARPAMVQFRQSRSRRDPLIPAADAPVSETPAAGDGPAEPAAPVRSAPVPRLAVVAMERSGAGRPDADLASADCRRIVEGCRRLVCAGARPWVYLRTAPEGESGRARRRAVDAVCRTLHVRSAESFAAPLAVDGFVLVGVVEPPGGPTPSRFQTAGDVVLLLGEPVAAGDPLQGLGGSAYLDFIGPVAPMDLESASVLNSTLLGLVHEGVIRSALDCGTGGLATCLVECCAGLGGDVESAPALGVQVEFPAPPVESGPAPRSEALLFGESPNRVVVTVAPADAGRVIKQCRILGVPALRLGVVVGDGIQVTLGGREFRLPISELQVPAPSAPN